MRTCRHVEGVSRGQKHIGSSDIFRSHAFDRAFFPERPKPGLLAISSLDRVIVASARAGWGGIKSLTHQYRPRIDPCICLSTQGSSLFFLTYSLAQVPSNMVLVRVGGPLWLGIIVTLWGMVATLFAGECRTCTLQECLQGIGRSAYIWKAGVICDAIACVVATRSTLGMYQPVTALVWWRGFRSGHVASPLSMQR